MKNKLLFIIIFVLVVVLGVLAFSYNQVFSPNLDSYERPVSQIEVAGNKTDARESKEELFSPQKAEYKLNTQESTLKWQAGKFVGEDYYGKVPIQSGFLKAKEGEFYEGRFIIDMTGMSSENGSDGLMGHLKDSDFFDVKNFPTAQFELNEMIPQNESTYKVSGDLTILGETETIDFEAIPSQKEEGVRIQADFEIDRTKWGIQYGSGTYFSDLGDRAIRDDIRFSLDLIFD